MTTKNSALALAAAALAAAACGGGPSLPPPPTPMPPPEQLYYDNAGGIREKRREVILDAAALERFWRDATSVHASPPAVPPLNFDREMAILVSAGRMTPDDRIRVDSLFLGEEQTPVEGRRLETLIIVVRTIEGCRRVQTDAYPVQILRARRFTGPVRWQEKPEQAVCRDDPNDAK